MIKFGQPGYNEGETNPSYKADKALYGALHAWVRRRKNKPKWCVRCRRRPAIDLANINGEYNRDVKNYEYLCRRCHMRSDGRSQQLRDSGKSRIGIPKKLWNKVEWRQGGNRA